MLRRGMFLLAAIGMVACDSIPTEPPAWVQKWVLPGETIEVHVAEFLPDDVVLSPDGSRFRVTTAAVDISSSLGDLCSECQALDGAMAPKPEFTDTLLTSTALPAELLAAVLAGGELSVTMAHNLSFDPLRPRADMAETGHMVITVTSDGNVVARDSINGVEQGFPSGATLIPNLPIQVTAVTNALDVEVVVYSPAGDLTQIETSDTLGVALAASAIDISQATIEASAIDLIPTSEEMDFGGVDSTMVERIQGGALRFEITNPFAVTGQLTIGFDPAGSQVVNKALALQSGTFSRRIEMTGTELRSLLVAETVVVTTGGNIAATGGTITVTPTQVMILDTSFELDILVGGEEGGP